MSDDRTNFNSNGDFADVRIVIVTTDEPFYIPVALQKVLQSKAAPSIRRIVILPPTTKKGGKLGLIREQLHLGLYYFLYRLVQYVLFGLLARTGRALAGRYYSVAAVASAFNVPVSTVKNINQDDGISLLRDEEPDLVISISASQIFSKRVLAIARWATLNVHNAPLPKYQGLMPSFWVLNKGEQFTAVTVHEMVEKLDSGAIVVQHPVKIDPYETLDSLIRKTKARTAEAIVESIALYLKHDGAPPLRQMDLGDATYFGFPSRADVRSFRRNGGKLL